MQSFTAVDLTPQGEVRLSAVYEYSLLEQIPGAVEIIARLGAEIWRSPEEFDCPLAPESQLRLRWRSTSQSAGIATVRNPSQTLSLSLVASGLDSDGDVLTLDAFQRHIVRELHDTGFEPSFDLIELKDRPLIATIGLVIPGDKTDKWVFALADRCFAAAYFRRLGLA
jgi:hypothetical protein